MNEWKVTPGRVAFVLLGAVLLVGVLTYLRLAFEGADVKTAVRLVEEAKAFGVPIRVRLEKVLPLDRRLCSAAPIDSFQGHMEVRCQDISNPNHLLKWRVDVIDGQVIPANDSAMRLGKGDEPWATK